MQSVTASKVEPANCYDCYKALKWKLRDTAVGVVGFCQCCVSDYLFHDDEAKVVPVRVRRRMQRKPRKTVNSSLLLPLTVIATLLIVVPALLFSPGR